MATLMRTNSREQFHMNLTNDSFEDDSRTCVDDPQSSSTNPDKKRARKAVFRRTIDYNSSVGLYLEQRTWKRKFDSRCAIQPDAMYRHLITPPIDYRDNPMNCVCAKHVRTSTNKNKCPIYSVCWTPDGRRLITGGASGEFTLWNGLTFNFETILQAHDSPIKTMEWSRNEEWLVSADDSGFVKYWQTNMNDVHMFQAHKDAVRGLSLSPSDEKFATCSNDSTVRIWDFRSSKEERVLRGHGSDVVCVEWHPTKSILFSGSRDAQKPLNLWDPKSGEYISTMHVHKNACNDIAINRNGHLFLTASKDHSVKLFDLRNLKAELQVFHGHKKDVNQVAWHPVHENLFVSGSGDGALLYWLVGVDHDVGAVRDAHDNIIWSLDWHPMGHILASGSNDFATKFWTRNRPGDVLADNAEDDNVVKTTGNSGTTIKDDRESRETKDEAARPDLAPCQLVEMSAIRSAIVADIGESGEPDSSGPTDTGSGSDIPGLSGELDPAMWTSRGDEAGGHSPSMATGSGGGDRDDERGGGGHHDYCRDSAGGGAVRVIPKQFLSNWENKKSIPFVFTSLDGPGNGGGVGPNELSALIIQNLQPLLTAALGLPLHAPPQRLAPAVAKDDIVVKPLFGPNVTPLFPNASVAAAAAIGGGPNIHPMQPPANQNVPMNINGFQGGNAGFPPVPNQQQQNMMQNINKFPAANHNSAGPNPNMNKFPASNQNIPGPNQNMNNFPAANHRMNHIPPPANQNQGFNHGKQANQNMNHHNSSNQNQPYGHKFQPINDNRAFGPPGDMRGNFERGEDTTFQQPFIPLPRDDFQHNNPRHHGNFPQNNSNNRNNFMRNRPQGPPHNKKPRFSQHNRR